MLGGTGGSESVWSNFPPDLSFLEIVELYRELFSHAIFCGFVGGEWKDIAHLIEN